MVFRDILQSKGKNKNFNNMINKFFFFNKSLLWLNHFFVSGLESVKLIIEYNLFFFSIGSKERDFFLMARKQFYTVSHEQARTGF